tara:strand:+ start:80 stop:1144 length:1065 start_codon:yes stop_codon:yes gene_type:complete
MGRKKKNIQQKFRQEQFKHDQFWNISYTEKYSDSFEKDFKTVIKAKSYSGAKDILLLKLEEDDPSVEAKAIQGFMFHKTYRIFHPCYKQLGVKEWEHIHNCAFPNENNVLFKMEMPRPEWKTNRFNGSGKNNLSHIKKFGFKKGEDNWAVINVKGKILDADERADKIYKGKWVEWKEEDRNQKKNEVIDALNKADNVRKRASELLGINRNTLYYLFKKFPEVDWAEEYPAPPPSRPTPSKEELSRRSQKGWATMKKRGVVPFGGSSNTPESIKKSIASRKKTMDDRRNKKLLNLEPKIRKALSANKNSRKLAAKYLNIKESYLAKCMYEIKKFMGINWSKEYPNRNINIKYRND